MTRIFQSVVMLSVAVILSACASGPELEKYSRTEIERPYTLPEGVATWQIPMMGGYFKDNSGSVFLPPIPVPLVWQSSLSDTWTLNWAPLPLSVSHQFSYSSESVLGTTFGLNGLGYATDLGMQFFPSAKIYWRTSFSKAWGLEVSPGIASAIATKGDTFRWEASVGVGPIYQATETFALRASLLPSISSKFDYATLETPTIKPASGTRFTMPISVGTVWSFHRQWDFRANYAFNTIGQDNGYQSHTFLLNFVHFW